MVCSYAYMASFVLNPQRKVNAVLAPTTSALVSWGILQRSQRGWRVGSFTSSPTPLASTGGGGSCPAVHAASQNGQVRARMRPTPMDRPCHIANCLHFQIVTTVATRGPAVDGGGRARARG